LNKKCGFLGVSEYSSDSRDIEGAIRGEFNEKLSTCPKTEEEKARVSKNSKLAAEILAYQVKKYIGSYAAAMNGLDAIVFTAGIGENDGDIRRMICEKLEPVFGTRLNEVENKKRGEELLISSEDSKVKIYVIPTDEELMIAKDTARLVK
jgi:acetate kinase